MILQQILQESLQQQKREETEHINLIIVGS